MIDPVVNHWPAFGRHGKERITLRHLLQHRAGIPLDNPIAILFTLPSWTLSIEVERRSRRKHHAIPSSACHAGAVPSPPASRPSVMPAVNS